MEAATRWVTIEQEDVEQEGWIIVPADNDPKTYAMQGATELFSSEEAAERAKAIMISKGVVGIGDVKTAPARLKHHRTVEVQYADTPPDDRPRLILVT